MPGPSKPSDFNIYQEQFQGGYVETLAQNTEGITELTSGGILMTSDQKKGDYEQEAFFSSTASIVTRQDLTSVAGISDLLLEQNEFVGVKLARKIGPVSYTRNAFNRAGLDPEQGAFVWGQQVAKAVIVEKVNTALAAARAAMVTNTDVLNDVTGASVKTCTHANMIGTMRKFGDASNKIVSWVMHSTSWFDLGLDAVSNSVDSVVSDILRVYDVPMLGRRVLVTDSPSLIATADTPDSYFVLGLTAGGIEVEETQNMVMLQENVLGLEQLAIRIQGEHAYNLSLKGYAWDIGNGAANPTDNAVATGTNWDQIAADDKNTAGVVLKSIAAS